MSIKELATKPADELTPDEVATLQIALARRVTQSPELIEKRRRALAGRKLTSEHKAAIAEGLRLYHAGKRAQRNVVA